MGIYETGYQGNFNPNGTATIAISTQQSSTVNCAGFVLCGILLPATFTGTALTFYACNTSSGTFQQIYNSSGPVSYTVAGGQYIAIDPKDFQGVNFLQIKSGSSEAAARTLVLSLKGF